MLSQEERNVMVRFGRNYEEVQALVRALSNEIYVLTERIKALEDAYEPPESRPC